MNSLLEISLCLPNTPSLSFNDRVTAIVCCKLFALLLASLPLTNFSLSNFQLHFSDPIEDNRSRPKSIILVVACTVKSISIRRSRQIYPLTIGRLAAKKRLPLSSPMYGYRTLFGLSWKIGGFSGAYTSTVNREHLGDAWGKRGQEGGLGSRWGLGSPGVTLRNPT